MQKKKLRNVPGLFLILAVISVGFYSISGDNDKTTPDTNSTGISYNSPSYDGIDAGVWTQGSVIATPSLAGGMASYTRNDTKWLYVIGGDLDFTGNIQTRNARYNINTNSWSIMAPYPNPISYTGSARLKDSIYVAGGMTTNFFSSETAAMNRYSITQDSWVSKAPLPQALGYNKMVGYQDSLIYSIGGMNAGGSTAINSVYLYNANSNTWRTATPLPAALQGGAAAVTGDTIIYIGGGATYFSGYTLTVYRGLISQANRSVIVWTTGTTFPGNGYWGWDAAPWGCKGIIIGPGRGNTTFGSGNQVWVYGSNTWTQQPNIPVGVSNTQLGTVGYSTFIWKLVAASGEDYPNIPYVVNNTQIFTDTLCPPPLMPLCETFTDTTFPPAGWTDDNLAYCHRTTASGHGGCTVYDNWNAPPSNTANLTTLVFSTSNPGDSLFVEMAYNTAIFTGDSLTILSSVNGGSTFTSLVRLGGSSLSTTTTGNDPFTPTINQWAKRKYALPVGTNRIIFHGYSNFGDMCYIDSTCIGQRPVGIIHNQNGIPRVYSLSQNYPNPFNPSTVISFGLPKSGNVKLVIYDILGREIKTLVNEFRTAGTYNIIFDASSLASGVYFYKLQAGNYIATKKMLLIK